MSPEQLASARDVDARADLWSLGVLMFELLTGRVPFMGQTLLQLCTLIVSQPIPRITLLRRDVPPELERVIERCLEKDRAHRYANIAELAVALQAFAPPHAITSVGRVSKVIRMAGGNVPSAPPPTPTPPGGGALPRGAVTEVTHAASTAGGDRVASAFPSRPPLRSALSLVGFVLGAALTLAVATFALHRLRSTSPGTAPGSTTVEAPPTPRELPPSSSPPAGPTADVGPSPAAAPSTIASAAPIASTSPDHPVHPSRRAAPPLRRPESAPLPATAKPEAPTVLPEDRK
jgi:serine/threonine-protein kinase